MMNTKKSRKYKNMLGYTFFADFQEAVNLVLGGCIECGSVIPDGKQEIQKYMCLECLEKDKKNSCKRTP